MTCWRRRCVVRSERQAADIDEPALDDAALRRRGAVCFRDHCAACHGAPSRAAEASARSMQPVPGPLVDAARHWRPRELLWILRHGITMSGMPAWSGQLGDTDLWALVAFMQELPSLSPLADRQLQTDLRAERCEPSAGLIVTATAGPSDAGRYALQRHACHACHRIPGIVGSARTVGPPLAGFGRRQMIAGRLPSTPDNLAHWIARPQHVDPGNAMPDQGIGADDARAMAEYLSGLH